MITKYMLEKMEAVREYVFVEYRKLLRSFNVFPISTW
jgi:hypothetical protein